MTDKDPQKSPHIKDKFEFTLIIKEPPHIVLRYTITLCITLWFLSKLVNTIAHKIFLYIGAKISQYWLEKKYGMYNMCQCNTNFMY